MLAQEILNKTKDFFKKKNIESARLEAEILISTALKWDRVRLYTDYDYPMQKQEVDLCREYVKRRSEGEPVAYIVGKKYFYNSDFKVSPSVLIPRSDTETLVVKALNRLQGKQSEELVIYDLGTGSGCVGLSLLKELPTAKLLAFDISSEAIEVAKENAELLGVNDRVSFYCGDILSFSKTDLVESKADIIVSNPPYIAKDDVDLEESVLKYEPSLALFAEDKGLKCIKDWSNWSLSFLKPEGYFLSEFGHKQQASLKDIFISESNNSAEGYQLPTFYKDLSGKDRVLEVKHG